MKKTKPTKKITTARSQKPKAKRLKNAASTSLTLPELVTTLGGTTRAGQLVTPENSKNVATAYRCGNIISDDVAKMPLQTYISRGPGELERMKPDGFVRNIAWRLERQPNRWWTPFWFKKVFIQWLLYWGNSYIWQPPTGQRELFILPADVTYPVFDLRTGDIWYATTFRGESKQTYIPGVEVLHCLINPDFTGNMGRGVIQFARETLGRQLAAYGSQSTLFKSGLSAAGILWLNGESEPKIRKKVRDMYEETMSGDENSGRIAILDTKVSKFEQITLQPKDVQFLQMMQENDIAIANFFGMPAYKLNMGKQSYQSNEQNNLDYLSTTLDPHLVQIEEAAAVKWLSLEEQAYTFFRFERAALYRTDAKSRGDYLNGAIANGRLTPNEGRQIEDRPKSNDPAADLLYMNSSMQPISNLARSDQ